MVDNDSGESLPDGFKMDFAEVIFVLIFDIFVGVVVLVVIVVEAVGVLKIVDVVSIAREH